MIPSTNTILTAEIMVEDEPSLNYAMQLERNRIHGKVDGLEAMKQVVFKILQTERYQYIIYSWNYGIELIDLYGQPDTYVLPELERRITEALVQDDRILSVDEFEFTFPKKGEVLVTFKVHTTFGDIEAERTVNF